MASETWNSAKGRAGSEARSEDGEASETWNGGGMTGVGGADVECRETGAPQRSAERRERSAVSERREVGRGEVTSTGGGNRTREQLS